jgi:hypothetical protein
MVRRCLDCPRLIQSGSRCKACQRAYRTPYARTTWPEQVKRRDGYRCRVPGCTTPHDRLQAHHIRRLADGGTSTLANGVTLCHRHHQQAHGGR